MGVITSALKLYGLYYFSVGGLALADNQWDIIGPPKENLDDVSNLLVGDYKVTLPGGDVKDLKLVGEYHFYTPEDERIASEIVDSVAGEEGVVFASEYGEVYSDGPINITWREISSSLITLPSLPWIVLGLDLPLNSEDIGSIAAERGYDVQGLSDPRFEAMTNQEYLTHMAIFGFFNLVGPGVYFLMDSLPTLERMSIEEGLGSIYSDRGSPGEDNWIKKRDEVFANGLADILQRDSTERVIMQLGEGHYGGVERELGKLLELNEVNRVDYQKQGM